MSYVTLVYNASAAAAGATNVDFTAATDPDFSQRNGHYIFTESYRLAASAVVGASVVRGRYQVPVWNAIGEFVLFGANRALTPPTNPQWDLWLVSPPRIPTNEEFQVQVSNNLGAATEVENVVLQLLTDDWTGNLPQGQLSLIVRASFTATPVLNGWSGPQLITFSQSLRGGVYAVMGAVVQGANAVAYRLVFPRARLYGTRKLRPGGLVQTAVGDILSNQFPTWVMHLGELGRFHTFEPVQVEVFGAAATSTTYQVFLWLAYMGPSENLVASGPAGMIQQGIGVSTAYG